MFKGGFKGVLRMSKGCLQGVSRLLQECFNRVSRKFHRGFQQVSRGVPEGCKVDSRMFHGCYMEISRVFHKCFRGVSEKFHVFLRVFQCSSIFDSMFTRSYNVFQWCFKEFSKKKSRCVIEVLCCMALIAATRADGGLVLYPKY